MQKYNDYGSMQRAAQRRVYEMQRRSRLALENNRYAPEPVPAPEPEPECALPEETQEQKTDPELFLLAAILALLVSEKADPRLIAALLYII